MFDFPPLYEFPNYWQRKIYKFGIENGIRELDDDPKVWDVMNYGMFRDDEDRVVEWRPRCTHLSDTAVFCGYILFVKEEIAKGKKIEGSTRQFCFRPTVEVRVDLNGGKRLMACRKFECGDLITFLTAWEVENEKLGLGGRFARTGGDPNKCNAYLTKCGGLRATKPIKRGEEIFRGSEPAVSADMLNLIDRLVIYNELEGTYISGRIGAESFRTGEPEALHVFLKDGTSKIFRNISLLGSVYNNDLQQHIDSQPKQL